MALYGWMMFLSVLPAVKKIHKNFDFDMIDAHYVFPDGFAAILLGRFFKRPVVVSARGSDINLFQTFPVIRRRLQYVLRSADGIIAVSQALKDTIARLGIPEEKITCIPNGVDPQRFYPVSKKEARKELGLPDRRTVLSVGNLTDNKGFDLVIKAFRILADKFHEKEVQLAIVGDGPRRSQLERTIAASGLGGRVHMVGPVAHDSLRFWYSGADVFCLASSREGWPNVILESLACGTPVVATSAGGIPEIIRSDALGLLTERDEASIAGAIYRALKKSWRADDLVAYARNHTWDHTSLAVLGVFQSILDRRNPLVVLDGAIQA
jgi:glycosyltransferase involved in cell wall biosynthesis